MIRARGFSLLELMVVVAVITILAAVAIPAYGRYAYRARRADGKELLLRVANAEERFYSTANAYFDLSTTNAPYSSGATSEKGYYTLSLALNTASGSSSGQSFTATVTPVGAQSQDACGALTIDNTGTKTPNASNATANSNGSCW